MFTYVFADVDIRNVFLPNIGIGLQEPISIGFYYLLKLRSQKIEIRFLYLIPDVNKMPLVCTHGERRYKAH